MKKYIILIFAIVFVLSLVVVFKLNFGDKISYREAIKIADEYWYERNTKTEAMKEAYIDHLKYLKTYVSKIEYDGKSYYRVHTYTDIPGVTGGATNVFIDSDTGEIISVRFCD